MRRRLIWIAAALLFCIAEGCAKKVDDTALVTNIKAQMFSDAALKGAALDVNSKDGQVTLMGDVPNDAAHLEAYKIASQTPGVNKVDDQIVVQAVAPAEATKPTESAAVSPARAVSKAGAESPKKDRVKKSPRDADISQPESANNEPPATPTVDQSYFQQNNQSNEPPVPAAPAPPAQPIAQPAAPPPPPPQPRQVAIQAGSTMTIRMIDAVDSSVNQAGEIFHASLDFPLVVNNQVVVPAGADVYVRLASANSAGHMTGKSELHLELIKLEFQGQSYPLVSSTYSLVGDSRGKNTAEKVGGGAVLGAIIGAIAGGGKGAAIGAGVGGGAGGVYQGATRGKQVKIPSETKLEFQLDQPVTVTVIPRSNTSQ